MEFKVTVEDYFSEEELHDFDDDYELPRELDYCPRCGAKVVGE